MFNKIWDFLTSDDMVGRLLMRAALVGGLVAIAVLVNKMNTVLWLCFGLLILLAVFTGILFSQSQKRQEKEEQESRRKEIEEDDGVTGFIKVRPDELEGPPWEIRPKKSPQDVPPAEHVPALFPEPSEPVENFKSSNDEEQNL